MADTGALVIGVRLEATRLLECFAGLRISLAPALGGDVDCALQDIAFSQSIAQGPRQVRLARLGAALMSGRA